MLSKIFKILFLLPKYSLRLFRYCKTHYFNFILLNTKFLFSKRISCKRYPACQQKTYLTGLGKLNLGKYYSFGYKLGGRWKGGSIEIQPRYKDSLIKIGNNVNTNNNLFLCAANYIEIGDDVLIGQNVCIMDHEAQGTPPNERRKLGEIGKVIIRNNVWIGNNVTILKNSEIGENSIIATGAVVSGKFPEDVIIGGVPAKIIKKINVG